MFCRLQIQSTKLIESAEKPHFHNNALCHTITECVCSQSNSQKVYVLLSLYNKFSSTSRILPFISQILLSALKAFHRHRFFQSFSEFLCNKNNYCDAPLFRTSLCRDPTHRECTISSLYH